MFVRDLGAMLWRRWYLFIAGVLLAVGLAAAVFSTLPATYQATASVVLLPPTQPETGENRFLGLGDLSQAVDVVIRSVTANDVQREVEGDPPKATFVVTPDYTSDAPLMIITAKGGRAATEALLDRVVLVVQRELTRIQTSVNTPDAFRISALTVTRDKTPQEVLKPKIRLTAVAFVGALGVAGFLLAAADGLLLRRSQRRREDAVETGDEPPETSTENVVSTDPEDEPGRPGVRAVQTTGEATDVPKSAVRNRRSGRAASSSRRRALRSQGEVRARR